MPPLLRIIAAGMLSLSLGLHWAVLQSAAWAGMLVDRVQEMSVGEAIRTTFDGAHPCRLCQVVQEGRAAAKAEDGLPQGGVKKLDVFPLGAGVVWVGRSTDGLGVRFAGMGEWVSWSAPPESPPPRRV